MAIIPRLFAVWFNHCCSFAVNAIQTMQSCILSEKFLMLFPKVVGAGGWFAGAMMSSRQAINHDGIDGRLAAAGSPRLHHHAGAMEIAYDTARSLSDSIQILPSPGETLSYEIKTLSARRFKIKRQSNLTMT